MANSDDIRVGDPERQRAVDLLAESMATSYLTLQEFEERTDRAYRATNRGELFEVVRDLPNRDRLFPPNAVERAQALPPEVLEIDWTTVRRVGAWTVPERMTISGNGGTAKLDFRNAEFVSDRLDIDLHISMSTIVIQLAPEMRLDATGVSRTGLSSMRDKSGDSEGVAGPLVILRGSAAAGSQIKVSRRPRT